MGQEPDLEKMPLSPSDFPEEVQVAFFLFDMLPNNYVGMDGNYAGKAWNSCEFLFKIYGIEDIRNTFFFMQLYDRTVINYYREEAKKASDTQKRKADAAAGGGKRYTHNVKG